MASGRDLLLVRPAALRTHAKRVIGATEADVTLSHLPLLPALSSVNTVLTGVVDVIAPRGEAIVYTSILNISGRDVREGRLSIFTPPVAVTATQRTSYCICKSA